MDIGSLTGQLALEDQISGVLTTTANRIKEWAQGFDNAFGAVAIGAGIAAAAIAGAAISIVALGDRGSDINDVSATLDKFAGSAENASAILDKMRQGTLDTVDNMDLMKSSSKLLAAGVNLTADNFKTLSSAAFVLQNQGLGPTKDMLELVSQAMLTGRTRSLELKLGKMDLSHAEENFAKTIGTTADQLSFSGKLEAKRIGLLEALEKKVKDAGAQERDFGEQLEFARAKIANWVDELAQAVASSPAVMNALTSIGTALQEAFGSKGEGAIKAIVGAINTFSTAVSDVVPYIVTMKNAVVGLFDFVDEHKMLFTTVAVGFGVYQAATVAVTTWNWLANTSTLALMVSQGTLGASARAAATGLYASATAAGAFVAASGPLIVAVAGITAVVMVGYQAWKLYQEQNERAGLDARNLAVDQKMIADATKLAGHGFGSYSEALAFMRQRSLDLQAGQKALVPGVKDVGKAHEDATGFVKGDGEATAALLKSWTDASQGAKIFAAAFGSLTSAQLANRDVQKMLLPEILKINEAGRTVPAAMRAEVEAIMASDLALRTKGINLLAASGTTLEYIEQQRRMGLSEAEIAFKLQVTSEALKTRIGYLEDMKRVSTVTPLTSLPGVAVEDSGKAYLKMLQDITAADKAAAASHLRVSQASYDADLALTQRTIADTKSTLTQKLEATSRYYTLLHQKAAESYRYERQQIIDSVEDQVRALDRSIAGWETLEAAIRSAGDASLTALDADNGLTQLKLDLDKAAAAADSLGETLGKTLRSIPETLRSAFEGGGGLGGALMSLAVQFGQDFGTAMSNAIARQLNEENFGVPGGGFTGSALSGRTAGLAIAGGALAGGTAAASGASTGRQVGAVASAAVNTGMMTFAATGSVAASVALAAYTAGAGLAVIAAFKIYKAMNDGRKVMQDYYKTFKGGADELRHRMLALGDEGEQMWIKLTQMTGKGDKKGAQLQVAAIEMALLRQETISTAGGILELSQRALTAGVTLTAMLDAKTPEAYKIAIDELNAAFEFQDSAMKLLDETAAKYGLTLSEMGPKYAQGKLDEQFRTLFQDQEILKAGGVDYDLILTKQAESYRTLIEQAIASGATIPLEMKPAVERMKELGLFTDDAGNAMVDLTKLKFAETLDSKFETLITTIGKLVEAIERGLSGAIAGIPQPRAPWENWPPPPSSGRGPRSRYEDEEDPDASGMMASGGMVIPAGRSQRELIIPVTLRAGNETLARQVVKTFVTGGL